MNALACPDVAPAFIHSCSSSTSLTGMLTTAESRGSELFADEEPRPRSRHATDRRQTDDRTIDLIIAIMHQPPAWSRQTDRLPPSHLSLTFSC